MIEPWKFGKLLDCYIAEFESLRSESRMYLGMIYKIGAAAGTIFLGVAFADHIWNKFPDNLFCFLPSVIFAGVIAIGMILGSHQVLVLRCQQIELEVGELFDGVKPFYSQTFASDKIQSVTSPVTLSIITMGLLILGVFVYSSYKSFLVQSWTVYVHGLEIIMCLVTFGYEWFFQLREKEDS